MVRSLFTFVLLTCAASRVLAADFEDASKVTEALFAGMAAHDAQKIRSTLLPNAQFCVVRGDSPPTVSAAEDFITHVAASKQSLIERYTKPAYAQVHGRMANVWGEYELLVDGKFAHCGVDSFTLFKTSEGWKIATIAYTAETAGCPAH